MFLGICLQALAPRGRALAERGNPAGPAIIENETAFGRFFVALQVHALISVRMRFILGGIRPIATISQSQNKNNELFANFLRLGDSSSLSQSGKEPQYSHFAVLSGLNLRSGELATIPNRKNVAIRSDFLFWAYGPASGRC